MSEVVLLYDSDCPNVADCRTNLIKAFAASAKKPTWREIDRSSDDAPPRLRHYGSPTVLVNGSDVAGWEPGLDGASCRLYQTEDGGYVGVPSVDQIVTSLCDGSQEDAFAVGHGTSGSGWKQTLAVLPAVGVALLPSITCPACWPGYAAVLSSFGIGFLPSNRYLLPLTATFLVIYLFMLAWEARKRHRFGPLIVGTAGSTVLVVGRFVLESNPVLYAGVAVLITASIWNAWPALKTKWFAPREAAKGCPACQSADRLDVTEQRKKDLTPDLTTGRIL